MMLVLMTSLEKLGTDESDRDICFATLLID